MNIPREELRAGRAAAERRREEWQQENGREPTVEGNWRSGWASHAGKAGGHAQQRRERMSCPLPGMNACWPRRPRTMAETFENRICFGGTRCAVWRWPDGQVLWMRFFWRTESAGDRQAVRRVSARRSAGGKKRGERLLPGKLRGSWGNFARFPWKKREDRKKEIWLSFVDPCTHQA